MKILTIINVPATMKPTALIVHEKPMRGRICCTVAGKTTPPVAVPDATIPIAKLLFLEK
jgi:hypothetical protein